MELENKVYQLRITKEKFTKYFSFFNSSFKKSIKNNIVHTKYLDLGVKIVRLQIADEDFLPLLEQYFSCCLVDNIDHYDATIYLWKDTVKSYISNDFTNMETLILLHENVDLITLYLDGNIISAKDIENNNYYFAIEKVSLDLIFKIDHLFVHFISSITTNESSALVHSACVGIDDKGVLICGRSGSGKSTLSVSCLVNNFQYVSDDYVILNKQEKDLYAYSIYSMIALSTQIMKQIPSLKTTYMGLNYNKTKKLLNISSYNNILKKIKIKVAMFPVIANVSEPTIEKMNKGRAITQLVYSTATIMNQKQNTKYIKLLMELVKKLDFYQINLSSNLEKNVKILKQFIKEL